MSRADQKETIEKPNQRRAKKGALRTKARKQQGTWADQLLITPAEISKESGEEFREETNVPVALTEDCLSEAPAIDHPVSTPVISVQQVSLQTMVDAYGNYARESFEQTWALLEKLAAARSPAKFFELQMEYAKLACETFIAESKKISELHGELAKQRVSNFEVLVPKITQTTLEVRLTRH
jgi:hypothetical protein